MSCHVLVLDLDSGLLEMSSPLTLANNGIRKRHSKTVQNTSNGYGYINMKCRHFNVATWSNAIKNRRLSNDDHFFFACA